LIEKQLMEQNIEYAAKRESRRLNPLKVVLLKAGSFAAFKESSILSGQREGQFKVVTLQYYEDCVFDFDHWTETND
ncbi:MAG: GH3 auxin-responsive promoter family protein, partial [Bdellovibrionales bacterium]|nr:GH3 auxin-responsive promoter family protein [Bdellovibrionales bacterium]